MRGFVGDLQGSTENNKDFRRVLYTGRHLQLVLMALNPGEGTRTSRSGDHRRSRGVDQLRGDPHAVTGATDAALQQ
jgi:hypothetical protein